MAIFVPAYPHFSVVNAQLAKRQSRLPAIMSSKTSKSLFLRVCESVGHFWISSDCLFNCRDMSCAPAHNRPNPLRRDGFSAPPPLGATTTHRRNRTGGQNRRDQSRMNITRDQVVNVPERSWLTRYVVQLVLVAMGLRLIKSSIVAAGILPESAKLGHNQT